MSKVAVFLKNALISLGILTVCFTICLALSHVFTNSTLVSGIFILGVFLTSVITDGYMFGIFQSAASVIAVNFAFTFPFFKLNFSIPENLASAVIMILIALITCALTARLKKQEKIAAESEREKTRADLLRAVSHDLRTPLTTIYGSSSALIEAESELSREQKMQMLKSIKEDSLWLFRMVENLLSVTKFDSGKVEIIKTPTLLDELVDSVVVKFYKRYKNQKVSIDIPDDMVIIPMDAMLIEQVIINILENAVCHAKGMTHLSLKVCVVRKKAVFEIEDNGCGISSERLKQIFWGGGLHETNSDGKRSNAGIGLSICKTIIEAHGGEINASNRKNGGAVFRFLLDTEDIDDDLQQI